jgi:hypothetical protein
VICNVKKLSSAHRSKYIDDETAGLFPLAAHEERVELVSGFTAVDVDYFPTSSRGRWLYCSDLRSAFQLCDV